MKPSATTERPAPGFPVTRWSMVALRRFLLANEWHRGQTTQRGGALDPVPLDTRFAERLYHEAGAHSLTPEQLFGKRRVLILIETTLARIESEYSMPAAAGVANGPSPAFAHYVKTRHELVASLTEVIGHANANPKNHQPAKKGTIP